jgi:hypothetical protein
VSCAAWHTLAAQLANSTLVFMLQHALESSTLAVFLTTWVENGRPTMEDRHTLNSGVSPCSCKLFARHVCMYGIVFATLISWIPGTSVSYLTAAQPGGEARFEYFRRVRGWPDSTQARCNGMHACPAASWFGTRPACRDVLAAIQPAPLDSTLKLYPESVF